MSESKYESKITSSACSAQQIYRVISNLQNLEKVKDLIPQDKVQEMEIEPDRVRMKVDGLGQKITIAIVDSTKRSESDGHPHQTDRQGGHPDDVQIYD